VLDNERVVDRCLRATKQVVECGYVNTDAVGAKRRALD